MLGPTCQRVSSCCSAAVAPILLLLHSVGMLAPASRVQPCHRHGWATKGGSLWLCAQNGLSAPVHFHGSVD